MRDVNGTPTVSLKYPSRGGLIATLAVSKRKRDDLLNLADMPIHSNGHPEWSCFNATNRAGTARAKEDQVQRPHCAQCGNATVQVDVSGKFSCKATSQTGLICGNTTLLQPPILTFILDDGSMRRRTVVSDLAVMQAMFHLPMGPIFDGLSESTLEDILDRDIRGTFNVENGHIKAFTQFLQPTP